MDFSKSYLIKVGAITSIVLIIIASFNALVDPFGFFGSLIMPKFNQEKPEIQTHVRMIKAHQIRLQKPDVIILGSSRAETGLNPEHPAFSVPQGKRYNLALHSANIYEILRYLEHAQSVHPLKHAVLGLDFFMFNANKQNEADFVEERLAPMYSGWLKDIFQALFTYDGLMSSLNTIERQDKPGIQYFPNGFRDDKNHWEQIQKKGGHHQAAINNEKYTLYALDGFTFFALSNQQQKSPGLHSFQKILTFCKVNKIQLHLFISPIHVRKMLLLHQIGLWEEFEHWKKSLVLHIENNAPEYSLWDFTGFNDITTEPFPLIEDKTAQMKWYWESSHYKKETGVLVLNNILNDSPADKKASPQFGIKLTTQNIDQHLSNQRAGRQKFISKYPEIVEEISGLIINTLPRREKLLRKYPDLIPLDYFKKVR